MSEFGESSDRKFDRISDFELGLMRERADGILAKPARTGESDEHAWFGEATDTYQSLRVERTMLNDGTDMLSGMKFESVDEGVLVTEYALSLNEGYFLVLRELHEPPVIHQSILQDMPIDTTRMLLELGQLTPAMNDLDDFASFLDEAKADQAKKLEELLANPSGKPATGQSIPIQFN